MTRSPSERPRGDVLSQAPPAGSRVDEGTVVALVASLGTGSGEQPAEGAVEVPRVVGLLASEAVEELRDAGLEARVRQVASSQRQGTVVDQTPSQGSQGRRRQRGRARGRKAHAQPRSSASRSPT